MITCNLMGGLGNQIFQIFTTISYAIKSKNQFKFTNAKTLGSGSVTIRNTYWDTFFSQLKNFTTHDFPEMKVIKEKNFMFNELPVDEMLNNNILLNGYFQSHKYFQENYDTICSIIGLKQMKDILLRKINYKVSFLDNTISMHFRLGDYKKRQDFHPIMTKEYYKSCIHYIKDNCKIYNLNVLYFCEDDDINEVRETITYLEHNFPEIEFIRGDNTLADWEQMLLMSCCKHNIIANSSFSWWGAYFNSYKDKIVCYPSKWFGKKTGIIVKDMYPIEWIKIHIFI
jgi:hypothetical protein